MAVPLLGVIACAAPDAPPDALAPADAANPDAAAPVSVAEVAYWLEVDSTGVTPLDGGGWATTTDRGYRVEVRGGWLVHRWATLGPCATFWGHEGAGPAQTTPLIEPIDRLASQRLGGASLVPPVETCNVHYLLADWATEAGTQTLVVDGSWQDLDDPAIGGALALRSDRAVGSLTPVSAPFGGDLTVSVTIRRAPARFFDGIDLAGAGADLGDQVLDAVLDATAIEITVVPHTPHQE